jgi:hypothetical protein
MAGTGVVGPIRDGLSRTPLRVKYLAGNASESVVRGCVLGGGCAHLKGDDGDDADAEIDHGQAVLPAEGAGVQEAGAGSHDPHEGGRSECPCNVCAVVDEGLSGCGVEPVEASGWGAMEG